MKTEHVVHFDSAASMKDLDRETIDLVVTSPPYPMIEMWDESFSRQNPEIGRFLSQGEARPAFELMHRELDSVWRELFRVLKPGGLACVNIGDAARTLVKDFALYPNHARIQSGMTDLGFLSLPSIIWRKQTNAPNKFMGSGMYPPGAYVTLEHEFILIFRKGAKRAFVRDEEINNRRESAYFWEERNQWFSDVWLDLKGTQQALGDRQARSRSGAFPLELPYRLIAMFSVKNDTVLDPFAGAGTTAAASLALGRNSVGYEIEPAMRAAIAGSLGQVVPLAEAKAKARLDNHVQFVQAKLEAGYAFKHQNRHYGFPVMTGQEADLLFRVPLASVALDQDRFAAEYQVAAFAYEAGTAAPPSPAPVATPPRGRGRPKKAGKKALAEKKLFD
ncbi:MAG: site-specific DNA-methyltransferase [Pseudomonadota bacterium]